MVERTDEELLEEVEEFLETDTNKWKDTASAFFAFGLMFAIVGIFLFFGLYLDHKITDKRQAQINSGQIIVIDGWDYSVEKKTLKNGKCYYVYSGGDRTFTIPCEEK